MPVSIVRFFNVYGPRLDSIDVGRVITIFMGQLLRGEDADGDRRRQADALPSPTSTTPSRRCAAAGLRAARPWAASSTSATTRETTILELAEAMIRASAARARRSSSCPQEQIYGNSLRGHSAPRARHHPHAHDPRRRAHDLARRRPAPTIEWFKKEFEKGAYDLGRREAREPGSPSRSTSTPTAARGTACRRCSKTGGGRRQGDFLPHPRPGQLGPGRLPRLHQARLPAQDAAHQRGQDVRLEDRALRHPAPGAAHRRGAARAELRGSRRGHEVGLHAWDHVLWQDRLHRLSRPAIDAQLQRGIQAFAEIYGHPPRAFAGPAWFCTDDGFEALDAQGFDYLSIARGPEPPYYPRVRGKVLKTLDIPTTVSTLDEDLGRDGITPENYVDRLVARYRPGHDEVLTVHAETEGLAYRHLFQQLLARHNAMGLETVPVSELAAAAKADAPVRDVRLGEIRSAGGGGGGVADSTCAAPRDELSFPKAHLQIDGHEPIRSPQGVCSPSGRRSRRRPGDPCRFG